MTALRRVLLLLIVAGVAGAWLRRRLEPPAPELPAPPPEPLQIEVAFDPPAASELTDEVADKVSLRLEMGPVTDEMNAIPLPLEEELALVDAAEPEPAVAEDDEEPEPADDELARVEAAEPEVRRVDPAEDEGNDSEGDDSEGPVGIVAVVDDLLEQAKKPSSRTRS